MDEEDRAELEDDIVRLGIEPPPWFYDEPIGGLPWLGQGWSRWMMMGDRVVEARLDPGVVEGRIPTPWGWPRSEKDVQKDKVDLVGEGGQEETDKGKTTNHPTE